MCHPLRSPAAGRREALIAAQSATISGALGSSARISSIAFRASRQWAPSIAARAASARRSIRRLRARSSNRA